MKEDIQDIEKNKWKRFKYVQQLKQVF